MSFWQITNIPTRRAPMIAMEWSPEDALALYEFYATQEGSTQPDFSNAQLQAGWTDGMRDAAKFLTDLHDACKASEVAKMFPETPWSTIMWGLRDKNLDRFKHILSKREFLDEWRTVSRVYIDHSGVVLTANDLEGGTQQAIFTNAPDVNKTTISQLAELRQFPPPEPLVSEEGAKRKIIKWESRCESDDRIECKWSEADAQDDRGGALDQTWEVEWTVQAGGSRLIIRTRSDDAEECSVYTETRIGEDSLVYLKNKDGLVMRTHPRIQPLDETLAERQSQMEDGNRPM